jgi:hypothetical protein
MKTSTTQAASIAPALSKVVAALAVAAMIGGMAMTPAHGKNDHDKGWHKGQSNGENTRPVYREHSYSPPIYVPAPVYIYPFHSPGVSLFFPLDRR